MRKEELIKSGLIEEYVLDLCSPSDKALVERMAEEDPEIQALVQKASGAVDRYCHRIRKHAPQRLKGKVRKLVQHHTAAPSMPTRTRSRLGGPIAHVGAFAAVVLLIAAVYLLNQNQNLGSQVHALMASKEALLTELAAMDQQSQQVQEQIAFLQDAATRQILLEGEGPARDCMAIVYWNHLRKQGMMKIVHLPQAPTGKMYQLWADCRGKMESLGAVADVSSDWMPLKYLEQVDGFHVTLAQNGGSDPAASQIVISGKI